MRASTVFRITQDYSAFGSAPVVIPVSRLAARHHQMSDSKGHGTELGAVGRGCTWEEGSCYRQNRFLGGFPGFIASGQDSLSGSHVH